MCLISHGHQPDFRKVSASIFPVRVRESVTVPSNAVKRRNGKQTGGRRLALRASLRSPFSTLAGPDSTVERMLANHTKCLAAIRLIKASDLNQLIGKLPRNKAPGPDQITAQMRKELPPSGQKILLHLYTMSV